MFFTGFYSNFYVGIGRHGSYSDLSVSKENRLKAIYLLENGKKIWTYNLRSEGDTETVLGTLISIYPKKEYEACIDLINTYYGGYTGEVRVVHVYK